MTKQRFKVMCIVGARPNFMKISPIIEAFRARTPDIDVVLLHTGQHYDHAMKALLFDQLGIPVPDIDLEVRGGSHAEQTANIMLKFEAVLLEQKPSAVLVVGDVNSTIACALVAVKLHIPVIHVEAGLRSKDLKMPEEINRLLTDRISQLLFTTERLGDENLLAEGVAQDSIRFVGNVMIDTLLKFKEIAPSVNEALDNTGIAEAKDLLAGTGGKFVFVTMHRPSNVDNPVILERLLSCIRDTSLKVPVIFAVHPRTKSNISKFGLDAVLESPRVFTTPPMGYLDSLAFMSNATAVLTDSGGIQEETTALGVPCITMRENTERWVTVEEGTNVIVGTDADLITQAIDKILAGQGKAGRRPELWDGHAAERIVDAIDLWLKEGKHVFHG